MNNEQPQPSHSSAEEDMGGCGEMFLNIYTNIQ